MSVLPVSTETNFVKIPISRFESRTHGIKTLLGILGNKDSELRALRAKYENLEFEHARFLAEDFNGISDIKCHLSADDSSGSLELGISEGTFYNVLKQLCEARCQLNQLKKTINQPFKIESWTQTVDSTQLSTLVDPNCEALKKNQELEKKIEIESWTQTVDSTQLSTLVDPNCEALKKNQELEKKIEIQKKEIESLTLKLQKESQEKRASIEEEKKSRAKLKREKELHEKTLQKLKDKTKQPTLVRCPTQRCSSPLVIKATFNDLEVDGIEEPSSSSQPCHRCQMVFPTEDELEDHCKTCHLERSKELEENLSEK